MSVARPGPARGCAGGGVVNDSETVGKLRRELGRRLAAARKNAGYSQREFALRISYSRSTVSTVESSVQRASRGFWEACDAVLGTGGEFALGHDRIRALQAAERYDPAGPARPAGKTGEGLRAATVAGALRAFRALGWPAVTDGNAAALVTGTVLDALEVPRAPGMLAACWWRCSGGAADDIRGLASLPDPRQALAVIACGDRFFFLAAAGSFPWAGHGLAAAPPDAAGPPVVRWHSAGSRIPAPPTAGRDGQQATWAYLPPTGIQLASPVVLLDLLAKAAAATRRGPQALTLPGGVLAIPVLGGSPGASQQD